MTTESESARRLRAKAEELRTMADTTRSPEARRTFLRLADDYERLAEHVEGAWGKTKLPHAG